MSIHINIDLNGVDILDRITITRVSNLDFEVLPPDAISRYRVRHWGKGISDKEVFIQHRYGDGRLTLLARALSELGVEA